ncbi:hypothetical protein DFQ26_008454 [Actinomortierella ambigua]|nr:hypothetical protein DFQ26_008454 [Actinomortierella ambigua]
MILFLKTRYRLSVESGSIILFAYLANLQIKAPLLLERIFDDFFADSAFHEQERQKTLSHIQERHALRAFNTAQTFQRVLPLAEQDTHTPIRDEQTRRQAKRDAVRMWGVLYALDKTPAASPSASATCALVLSGATDAVDNAKQKQKLKQKQQQQHHQQPQPDQTSPERHVFNNNSNIHGNGNNKTTAIMTIATILTSILSNKAGRIEGRHIVPLCQ